MIKAYIYMTLMCPECGWEMYHDTVEGKPGTYKCYNPKCKLYEILFKPPSIELERVVGQPISK